LDELMRTRRSAILLFLLALFVAQCHIAGPLAGGANQELPADAQRLGSVRLATSAEQAGAIASADALAAANKAGYVWPNPQTFLVVVTSKNPEPSKTPDPSNPYALIGKLAWLIYWDGLKLEGGPVPTSTTLVFTKALVLLDAHTGTVLSENYVEY
jgi:hypothetical protein